MGVGYIVPTTLRLRFLEGHQDTTSTFRTETMIGVDRVPYPLTIGCAPVWGMICVLNIHPDLEGSED